MTAAARLIVATLVGSGGVWLLLSRHRPASSIVGEGLDVPRSTSDRGRSWTDRRLGPGRTIVGSAPTTASRRSSPTFASCVVLWKFIPPILWRPRWPACSARRCWWRSARASAWCRSDCGFRWVSRSRVRSLARSSCSNSMRSAAAEHRNDLRYQLSSYLDVVTMLLAGNVGNEGALRQAAQAGDGRLFVELRRRILIAETSNRSLVSALAQLGDDLDLVELQQISASASLAASAGAPVAKSLAAKCATLRGALSSEQEADARVRTGKITVPLVGMSLLIMAAVVYPALNFSR